MVQDNARQGKNKSNKSGKSKNWKILAICILVILFFLGVFFSKYHTVIKNAGKKTEHSRAVDKKQAALKKYIKDAQQRTGLNQDAKPKQPAKPKFDFYTLLPKLKVVIPKNQTTPVKLKPGQNIYILQFASVKDDASAQHLINELGASGVSASVEQFPINGQTWYRVVSAPYTSQQMASQVQDQLREQNIDSLMIKLKAKATKQMTAS